METTDYYLEILREIDRSNIIVTDWEAGFIESLLKRNPARLSDKQIAIINRMKDAYLTEQKQLELQMFDDPAGDDIPY
jgi:hypothetical protein